MTPTSSNLRRHEIDHPLMFLALLAICTGCQSGGDTTSTGAFVASAEPYPLSPEMELVEKDLGSDTYVQLLKAMTNPHDRRVEYQRLDSSDNAANFLERHGELEQIQADEQLRTAYERRKQIAGAFEALLQREIGERPKPVATQDLPPAAASASSADIEILPVVASPAWAKNWPRWRGPTGQGTSSETELPATWDHEKNVAWKAEVPGSGNSSPVIWGDRIFLVTAFDDGQKRALVCLRRSTGEILFQKETPDADPQAKIVPKTGYAAATPATDGERVVLFLGNVGLLCYSTDGELLWRYAVGPFNGSHGTGASPLIWNDLVILMQEQNGGPSLGVAVDKKTGQKRWSTERQPALGWCSPIAVRVAGRDQLLYAAKHIVVGIDPASGNEIWSCAGPTKEVVPTLLYGNGLVYCTSGRSGPTLAIQPNGEGDITKSHLLWRSPRGGPHVPSPVLWNDLLYLVNDTGIFSCLDAKTGAKVYQQRLGGRFTSSLLAADGKIYATSEKGKTFVIRTGRTYELLSANDLGESVLSSGAILDGQIFLRGEKHLFAIGEMRKVAQN